MEFELEHEIRRAMGGDQFRFRNQLRRLRDAGALHDDPKLVTLTQRVLASVACRESRLTNVPKIEYDSELPITARRDEIVAALRDNQVIVVAGETGSGKSTQLPKICLEAGFGIAGMIGHTQPRRIAARSVATRVAEELKSPLGEAVGYKVRFQDQTNPQTYIKLMTDGILLAEASHDRFLGQYDVIILDEAHERSLNIDFLLGVMTNLLRRRTDLRLIITSATIDAERFGEHFGTTDGPAPIISIEGRTYPVEVRYRPLESEDDSQGARDVFSAIVAAVHELSRDGGDMLVFLPTERDIREAAKRLRGEKSLQAARNTEVLPLYARLSTAEQNRIFHPGAARRIVLATNVAESSLTVPRIHSVIDTGTARISRYSTRMRMQRLPVEAVSRASADQRKGRCGRLGPGICVRLYSEADYVGRTPYTTPEIRRTNLASVILQAKTLGLGEVEEIPFLDPPRPESIRDGYKTLFELGAVDEHRALTELGRRLAKFPVDPRIARMILAADEEHCVADVLIIASALEVQDPRLRPVERQQAADEQHARFADEGSDFASFLKLWDHVEQQREKISRGQFQRMCERQFLSLSRLREWTEVHRQLQQAAIDQGIRPGRRSEERDAIHRSLLRGLLSCVAFKNAEHEYTGAGGNKLFLWPGSGLKGTKPPWIMAAELVETSQRFGRTVAKIDPDWLEPLAAHLVKRTCSDAHWHAKSLAVMAYERVTLFGLPIVARRPLAYGPIDPEQSRQLFIERGLVAQEMQVSDKFFRHNQQIRVEAEQLASKTRRREFILDEYRLHAFYEQRIPADAFDMASLRRMLRKDPTLEARLCMSLEDLLEDHVPVPDAFPSAIDVGPMQLPLKYRFEPGAEQDGVTMTVPVEALPQVHPEHVEWLVPGLVEEKLVALIRSLPKSVRRNLVPAPDTARRVARELAFGKGRFLEEVARRFSQIAEEPIAAQDFRLDKLPEHLRLRIEVVTEDGQVHAAGRDLHELRGLTKTQRETPTAAAIQECDSPWHRDGLTSWDFDDLPSELTMLRGSIEVRCFPAIVDQGETVSLRLLETAESAECIARLGVRRLYQLANRKALRAQVRWLPQWDQIVLWMSSTLGKHDLEEQLGLVLADLAFLSNSKLPRNNAEFQSRQRESGQRIAVATQDLAVLIPRLAKSHHQCRLAMGHINGDRWKTVRTDLQGQLNYLLRNHFLTETPWSWLMHMPRFLEAIEFRIGKLTSGGHAKDESSLRELEPHLRRLDQVSAQQVGISQNALAEYRWMLEEYRVSLFAQKLGTSIKVSPKRLEQQWQAVFATDAPTRNV